MKRWYWALALFLVPLLGFAPDERSREDLFSPELDEKLAEQWRSYQRAQDQALRSESEGRRVSRSEWEAWLAPASPWTGEELARLRARQDAIVEGARVANRLRSPIDLERLRGQAPERVREFCAALPKGGMLHIHPWGTLSAPALAKALELADPLLVPADLLRELGSETGKAFLYPEEREALRRWETEHGPRFRYSRLPPADRATLRAFFVLDRGGHPFQRFEAIFTLLRLVRSESAAEGTRLMWDDFFGRAREQGVRYVEVSSGLSLTAQSASDLAAWAAEIERRHGVTARWLAAFSRITPPEDLFLLAKKLLALPASAVLLGVNLVADETEAPMLERGQTLYLPLLRAAREGKTALHASCHAGELGSPHNPRDAMLFGVERLGHGVRLREDLVGLEYARRRAMPIETNLTSNLRLRAVPSIAEHPFLYFHRLGLRVSLSTDDEGIFGTDINHECELAVGKTDISYPELREMVENSLGTAFAPAVTLDPLKAELSRELEAFERKWHDFLVAP